MHRPQQSTKMNATQLKNVLNAIKMTVDQTTWDAAIRDMTSVTEVPVVTEVKPKRVLSPEHKAKMQAGRVAAKAKTEVPTDATPAEVAEAPVKPKRVLSPEHIAKMQAGRVAAKAKVDAPEVAEAKPKRVLSPEHIAKMQAGRKKKVDAPAVAEVAVAEVAVAEAADMIEVAGKIYVRLADGRCYERGDNEGELGCWAGMFKDGVLDTTVSEL